MPTPAAEATTTTVTTVAVAETAPAPAGTIPPVAPAPRAEVHVEQFVNGDDADVAPGATLLVDDRITWTYAVTNFGNVQLHGIVLVDSLGLKPVLVSGDNGDGQLTPTETWTFRAESRVAAGPQSSVATVTALDPSENPARDDDPSYYSGVRRAVIGDIVWNDSDGNAAPGPNETGIPGAHVVITNRATGDRQTVTTDATGGYQVAVEPGDYEVSLDMDTVDGELTTADEFEFTLDEGEWYLGADFGFDDELEGDESLPLTGRTTATALRLGAVALAAGAVLLGVSRTARKRAHVGR